MSDPAMDGPATDDLEGTDRDVADEEDVADEQEENTMSNPIHPNGPVYSPAMGEPGDPAA